MNILKFNYTKNIKQETLDKYKKLVYEIIGFNPKDLPNNKYNNEANQVFLIRAIYKLMLHTHQFIMFPRQFDPDLGQYIINNEKEQLPVIYEIEEILKTRSGNCGTYAFYFEFLCYILEVPVRRVNIIHKDKVQGHHVSEVLINGSWIMVDPLYCFMGAEVLSPTKINKYSTLDIIKNTNIYIEKVPLPLNIISKSYWNDLFSYLYIEGFRNYEIGEELFEHMFYMKNTKRFVDNIENKIVYFCNIEKENNGEKQSGLYDYYCKRLNEYYIFSLEDIYLICYIEKNYNNDIEVHELASGLGQVSLALSSFGFNTSASERDNNRSTLSTKATKELNIEHKIYEKDFRLLDKELKNTQLIFSVNAMGTYGFDMNKDATWLLNKIHNGTDVILRVSNYGIKHSYKIWKYLEDNNIKYEKLKFNFIKLFGNKINDKNN